MTKLSNAIIPVDEAKVEERQVTVQVLTIGSKQVTKAMYGQLMEENIINGNTGELKGRVWGWVNLHDSICPYREDEHLHIIWEKDGLLRKCCEKYGYWKHFPNMPFSTIEAWKRSYQICKDAGQLFIAVSGVWK